MAELWRRHSVLTAGYIPFGTYFNPDLPIADLLATNGGIIAEGPRRVMDEYADVLNGHVEAYVVKTRAPGQWIGDGQKPEQRNVQLLLLGSDSYVVGTGFSAAVMHVETGEPVT